MCLKRDARTNILRRKKNNFSGLAYSPVSSRTPAGAYLLEKQQQRKQPEGPKTHLWRNRHRGTGDDVTEHSIIPQVVHLVYELIGFEQMRTGLNRIEPVRLEPTKPNRTDSNGPYRNSSNRSKSRRKTEVRTINTIVCKRAKCKPMTGIYLYYSTTEPDPTPTALISKQG